MTPKEERLFKQINDNFLQIYTWQNMQNYYKGFQLAFREYINQQLAEFSFELVIYDETEFFPSYDDENFNYPFSKRKNVLNSYKFQVPMDDSDYSYPNQYMQFSRSETCL